MSFHEEIPIKDIAGFDRFAANGTLQPSRSSVNAALIGHPRGTYGADCQSPDNPTSRRWWTPPMSGHSK